MERQDIINRDDIEIIVNTFYERVNNDEMIGPVFAQVDWDKHLPVMYDFWDNVLFYTGNYTGNPMAKHQIAHDKSHMSYLHFERWLDIFNTTVDLLYAGKNAILIKERAKNIATILQIKILGHA